MKKHLLKLAPFFRVGMQAGKLYLGFGSIQKEITEEAQQKAYLEVASSFSPHKTNISFENTPFHEQVIEEFIEKKILIPEDLYTPKDRYSRHHLYYLMSGGNNQTAQEKLKSSHVVVIGCGGIGNLLATSLATAGIGKLTIIDNDDIELTNLTRQYLYDEADIGKFKVDVLKKNINAKNSQCEVLAIKKHFKTQEDLEEIPKADLIVVSADVDNVCDLLNLYCIKNNTPWINVGYVEDIAVWGPFIIPGKTGCMACQDNIASDKGINPELKEMMKAINRNYQAPSTGPINMLAISLSMFDILRFLGGFGKIQSLNKRIGLWTHELRFETQNYQRNPHCNACQGLR